MRSYFLLVFLLFTLAAGAQWADADRRALSVAAAPPDSLSRMLTEGLATDREKTRAIFRWITANIAYKVRSSRRPVRDTAWDGLPLDERVALQVLREGEGVCEGYARLFNTLCAYAGIRSVLVTGYARNESDRADRGFRPNHSWNAVWLDSAWHLLDATWAAGGVRTGSDQFVWSFDESYFLAPPELFIQNHYPEDLRWSLLADPPPLPEFRYAPLRTQAALKYRIQSVAPRTGLLRAASGDTLRLEVHLDPGVGGDPVAPGGPLEQGPETIRLPEAYIDPEKGYPSRVLRYTWVLDPEVRWLHLRCNDDVILHFRVEATPAPSPAISLH